MTSQPVVKLNSGFDMPIVGFGTFLSKPNEAGDSVREAIKAGYRHIDCASAYNNEDEIGRALASVYADKALGCATAFALA